MKMTRLIQLTIVANILAILGCATAIRTPDAATISKLESNIEIPTFGNEPPPTVSEYARYYAPYMAGDHRMIRGELVRPMGSRKPAGIYVVGSEKDFPHIFDGGCSVVHVVYDVETASVVSLKCNGYA
jgi:hypothetical protein